MSYIDFFEFREHPFRITPDVEFYFTSETHTEAYESLKYLTESDEGFMVLMGEPGAGKTITLRKFLNSLPAYAEYAYILFPSLQPEDMFRAVLEDFGYKVENGLSKNALFSGFRDFLTEKKQQGKKILLIIDEAQNLPIETLEELRILSNLETEKEKLIQFILAGQPELADKLGSEKLRQLRQRISLQVELKMLNATEVERYVVFRLSKAGYAAQYPNQKFYKKLYSLTGGNPRLINLTMERALMAAYLKQCKFLKTEDLDTAAKSLKLEETDMTVRTKTSPLTYILVGLVILLSTLLAVQFTVFDKQKEQKTETQTTQQPAVEKPAEETVQPQIQAPEPTPEPEQEKAEPVEVLYPKGYVIVDGLNMRSKPTTKEKNISAKLDKGTAVYVKAVADDWYLIELISDPDHAAGWVYKDYIIVPE